MATTALNGESFNDAVDKEGIVLVDWWASWCGPCRVFAPIYEKAAEAHPDLTWAKVDVDQAQQLAGAFAVRSIPTLMVFRDGILLFEQAGVLPREALDELVTQVKALDMNEVKARIAEQEAQAKSGDSA